MTVSERTAMAVITEAFAPLEGRRLLDIGCGPGALARALLRHGARPTGVDPSPAAVAAARKAAPEAEFAVGDARALSFEAGAFDGAVFLNSLHHVPGADGMAAALRESARVTGPGRTVVVVEPLARGSYFEAVRPVDDETAVRAEAAAAIAAAVSAGTFETIGDEAFERRERFESLDVFLARLAAVDADREAVIATQRPAIEAAFHANAVRDAEGRFGFVQPMRAVVLRVRAAP
jgi:ubiquinone/menaquinone biosynthesis C-methylase UbiE